MADKKNGLELLGAEIDKEIQEDIVRLERIDVEIPQELHEKMLALARELDKKRIAKEKQKRRQRMMKTAAVFAVVLIAGNFIALETSDKRHNFTVHLGVKVKHDSLRQRIFII